MNVLSSVFYGGPADRWAKTYGARGIWRWKHKQNPVLFWFHTKTDLVCAHACRWNLWDTDEKTSLNPETIDFSQKRITKSLGHWEVIMQTHPPTNHSTPKTASVAVVNFPSWRWMGMQLKQHGAKDQNMKPVPNINTLTVPLQTHAVLCMSNSKCATSRLQSSFHEFTSEYHGNIPGVTCVEWLKSISK